MPNYLISKEEWENIKEGDTVYMVRSGKARTVLPKHPNGSSAITLSSRSAWHGRNTTTYGVGDRYLFSLKPIVNKKKNKKKSLLNKILNLCNIKTT